IFLFHQYKGVNNVSPPVACRSRSRSCALPASWHTAQAAMPSARNDSIRSSVLSAAPPPAPLRTCSTLRGCRSKSLSISPGSAIRLLGSSLLAGQLHGIARRALESFFDRHLGPPAQQLAGFGRVAQGVFANFLLDHVVVQRIFTLEQGRIGVPEVGGRPVTG